MKELFKIKAKYVDELFCPSNAFSKEFLGRVSQEKVSLLTSDGIECAVEFQGVWNNTDGQYDEEFDGICKRLYSCPFSALKSTWFSRLGPVSDYWFLVKLIKI